MLKRIDELFPDPGDGGLFQDLATLYPNDLPWKDDVDGDLLDLDYVWNHSGSKFGAPMLQKMADGTDDGKIESMDLYKLAMLAWVRYGKNWIKLWATYSLEYDPIQNYSMTETEEGSSNEDTSDDLTHGHVVTGSGTDTVTTNVYAYNSATETPSEKVVSQPASVQTNSGTDQREIDSDKSYDRTLTRAGNIGVTTSQQMIQSERELWIWDFFEQVYKDVDKVTTIPIY